MEEQTEKKVTELAHKISTRLTKEAIWARRNFYIAQLFVWLAIISSFGTAIASATNKVPSIIIALLAAIPGTIILIDKNFSFARRAQWHYVMRAKLEQLENSLRFESATPEATSKAYSSITIEMEQTYPGMDGSGLADILKKP